ncbi:MAG: hypothetical protein V1735_06175 [Nanoarchaeota archaeon]
MGHLNIPLMLPDDGTIPLAYRIATRVQGEIDIGNRIKILHKAHDQYVQLFLQNGENDPGIVFNIALLEVELGVCLSYQGDNSAATKSLANASNLCLALRQKWTQGESFGLAALVDAAASRALGDVDRMLIMADLAMGHLPQGSDYFALARSIHEYATSPPPNRDMTPGPEKVFKFTWSQER